MVDEAQLKILKFSVEAWNQWRATHPQIVPDFVNADLSGTNLVYADLRKSNLQAANLSRSDLSWANLNKSNLSGAIVLSANLSRANLSGVGLFSAGQIDSALTGIDFRGSRLRWTNLRQADLRHARLSFTDLRGADLRDASLNSADLSWADLRGANLTNSSMGETILGANNLRDTKGLDTVRHQRPSIIGIDTIFLSKGDISEAFLKGTGVPDDFNTYMKSLVVSPIEYYSCFISYSTKDEDFANRLYADLQRKHVRCWFAPKDLKIGDKFRPRIDEAIRVYDKLLLIVSENSVNSRWVETEVEAAFEKEDQQKRLVLFPIRLDDAVEKTNEAWAADIRRTRHIGDFCDWKNHDDYIRAFTRLLRDLKAED